MIKGAVTLTDGTHMNEDTQIDTPAATAPRAKTHGIKFASVSHRKNKARKDAQHRKNVTIRAALYQERTRISAQEWHTRLNALSLGTT